MCKVFFPEREITFFQIIELPINFFRQTTNHLYKYYLGEPIKAFGEESRRGRRRHVRQLRYQDDQGRSGLRVQFHLQGLRHRGLAEVDAREVYNFFKKEINFCLSYFTQ